jgi:hypothetical protein
VVAIDKRIANRENRLNSLIARHRAHKYPR